MVTPDEVYRRLRSALVNGLASENVSASRVSIVTDERLDFSSDFFVQIRPAGGRMEQPYTGALELAMDRIEVSTWVAERKDQGLRVTNQLAGEDKSVLARIESVRRILRGNDLGGALVIPLRHMSQDSPLVSASTPGFIRCRDVWTCAYELASRIAYGGWSATAPTSLASLSGTPIGSVNPISRSGSGAEWIWFLVPDGFGSVQFWSEAGLVPFYSSGNPPPSGPGCADVTIDGVVYNRWRSPYPSVATSAVYRIRKA
jgi:hypothetical protein